MTVLPADGIERPRPVRTGFLWGFGIVVAAGLVCAGLFQWIFVRRGLANFTWDGQPAVIVKMPYPATEYAKAPVIKIDGSDSSKVVAVTEGWKGEAVSAELRIAFDLYDLHLNCVVQQGRPPVNNKKASRVWDGDAVEVYFSESSRGAWFSRKKRGYFDHRLVISPTSKSGKPVLYHGFRERKLEGARVTSKTTRKGYEVTASVPLWHFRHLNWVPGKKIRFDAAVSVAGREGDRAGRVFWNATSDATERPDDWGLAEFKDMTTDSKPPKVPGDVEAKGPKLAAPKQLSPPAGKVFNHYPRWTLIKWTPVRGALDYTVELDYGHGGKSPWWPSDRSGRIWRVVPHVRTTFCSFSFIGAQLGRWRVWAVDGAGRDGEKSPWREFSYTK